MIHSLMLEALRLSRQGFGHTAPNPMVGALLVREGRVLAQGWHKTCGGVHAERAVLEDARRHGLDPSACTLIVTLEPCNHYGRTPPCTEAVLEAGIKHVIIGTADPNPLAAGGAARLTAAGVRVEMGAAAQECLDNIADFLLFQRSRRAYLLLKLASTLDGRIAARDGLPLEISSPEALEYVHWLRSRVQAVLVGGNTFYADNPRLTARCGSKETPAGQPLAVVVGSRLPDTDSPFYLLRERAGSTIFFTSQTQAVGSKADPLRKLGLRVHGLEEGENGFRLEQALEILRQEYGCHYVLCEGGGRLGLSLLQQGLADEFLLHLAPLVLGDNKAKPIFAGHRPQNLEEAFRLRLVSSEQRGRDICLRFLPEGIEQIGATRQRGMAPLETFL